jgi:hypothetical protein
MRYQKTNMLFLITCQFSNLESVVSERIETFDEDMRIVRVPNDKGVFPKCVYLVITSDEEFLEKLQVQKYCDFEYLESSSNRSDAKIFSLYRVIGQNEKQYYEDILEAMNDIDFMMVENIVTRCRCHDGCLTPNFLVWIESDIKPCSDDFDEYFEEVFSCILR